MSGLFKRGLGLSILIGAAFGSGFGTCYGGVTLYSLEDAYASNDNGGTGGGPTAVNNRSDFFEVRNLVQLPSTVRKRYGYVKFDITGIDPGLYADAKISFSFSGGKNGAGVISVFGLIDSAPNANDPTFTESTWLDQNLSYSKGLGVDVSASLNDVTGGLYIDPAEATLLGVINIPGAVDNIVSDTTDLPLAAFLSADTNGIVSFILADDRGGTVSTEWRITAHEYDINNGTNLSTALNFGDIVPIVPGDTDGDGVVEPEDLTPIRTNWRQTGKTRLEGNLTGDAAGLVDFADFRQWKTAILAGGGSLAGLNLSFTSVPEPSTVLLFGFGLMGWVSLARTRLGMGRS